MSPKYKVLMGYHDPEESNRALSYVHPVHGQTISCRCQEVKFDFHCTGGHRLCRSCTLPVFDVDLNCPFMDCSGFVPGAELRRRPTRQTPAMKQEAATQTEVDLSHTMSSENTEVRELELPMEVSGPRTDKPGASFGLDFIGFQQPTNWTAPAEVLVTQGYALVKVSPHTQEGQQVLGLIPGLPISSVVCIERLENRELYHRFCFMKRQMARTLSPEDINERDLFSVLKKKRVKVIAKHGFDVRDALKETSRFGQGVQFDLSLKLQERPALGSVICVSKVLCGSWTVASPNIHFPPDRSEGLPFNSCVDTLDNPNVVIIYDNLQHYPCYFLHMQ